MAQPLPGVKPHPRPHPVLSLASTSRGAGAMRSLWIMGAALALAGCNGVTTRADPPRLAEAPLYCYKTLAMNDCYDTPRIGEAYRLMNYYGPPPAERGFFGDGRR